jgi:hypothetical protein
VCRPVNTLSCCLRRQTGAKAEGLACRASAHSQIPVKKQAKPPVITRNRQEHHRGTTDVNVIGEAKRGANKISASNQHATLA